MNRTHPDLEFVAENLFFIVGCGRSGTTLLKTVINEHSKVSIPHETFFFMSIANGIEEGSPSTNNIDNIANRWWVQDMGVTAETLRGKLGSATPSWTNLFLALVAHNAPPGTSRFGEKTAGHVRFADKLLETYPKARVLQIIRDPRAVLASFRSVEVGSNHVARIIDDWRRAVKMDQRLSGHERYYRINFEDLILETETTLKGISDFLELDFEEEMLNFHQRSDKGYSKHQAHHENTTKKIFTSGLEAWKERLGENDIRLIESVLAQELEQYGYEKISSGKLPFYMLRYRFSALLEFLEKQFIRRPKTLLKRIKIASDRKTTA